MLPLPRGAVWQTLFLLCAVLFLNEVRSEGRVVCYYTNWSVYRPGTAKFNPQNINPYLCTHLVYAFGGFTKDNQMKPFDKYQDIEQGGYAKFTGLKTFNKQLKTMIAIGGWNEASSRFSPLVANPERRQQFIKNILKFLRQNHFDGIDLDWEYPAHRQGGKSRDRDNYAQFVQELRAEFEREAEKTGRPRLLLTMAVPAGIEYIDKGYDIPKLNKYLDWFNLLSYDFHSSLEPSANHHAPLYSLEEESEYNYDTELNIDYSVKYYLKAGADRDKLVLGIPTYGRSFTLINEESTDIGAPSEGPGEQGDATREKGYLAYYEICQNLKEDPEWTVVQPNPNAMGPYAFRRNQWVGYDDEDIVRKKANYVVEHGLGGIMFWAIDNDDFRGTCTGKPYPLIEAAKEAMLDGLGLGINEVAKPSSPKKPSRSRSRENTVSSRNRISDVGEKSTIGNRKESGRRPASGTRKPTTTEAPRTTTIKLTEAEGSSLYVGGRTTTPAPPTTPDPGTDFKCEEEGFFQHPRDCKKYYWCLDSGPSGLGIVAHQFTCPSGLYFNPAADSCDFARNVPCKTKKSTTAAPVTSTTTTPRPTTPSNRITAATSRNSYLRTTTRPTTTTSTTTEAPPEEEEVEYEDEEDEPSKSKDRDPEEDPKVIQELIDLIRKLGGIEELEKHLLRKEDGSISLKEQNSSSSVSETKSSGIAKTLYEKVVSRPNTYNSFRNRLTSSTLYKKNSATETDISKAESSKDAAAEEVEEDEEVGRSSSGGSSYSKYSSVVRGNSRQGPQNEGLEKLPEFDAFIKEKKQYVTINRNRGSIKAQQDEEEEGAEEDDEENAEILDEEIVNTNRKTVGGGGSTQSYSTIRRNKTSTVKLSNEEDFKREEEIRQRIQQENHEKKIYATLNRTRGRFPTTEQPPTATNDDISTTNRYKYFERTRPTKPTTLGTGADELEANDDDENEEEQENVMVQLTSQSDSATQKSQTTRLYASIGRKTTTTTTTIAPTESTKIETPTKIATIITNQSDTTYSTEPTSEPISTSTATPTTTTTNKPELITTTSHPIASTSTSNTISTTASTLNAVDSSSLFDSTTIVPAIILSNSDSTENSGIISLDNNSLLHETLPTPESGLDTSNQDLRENIARTITTAKTTTKTLTTTGTTDTDALAVDDKVTNLNKNLTKTQYKYNRTRIPSTTTTTTTTTNDNNESTTNTTTNITSDNNSVENSLNIDNGKGSNSVNVKYSGGRRQQIKKTDSLYNIKSQIQTQQTPTSLPTTEPTLTNEFLGTVSSPRPFGFPRRRTRPSSTTTTTETSNNLSTVEQNSAVEDTSSFIKSTDNTKKKYQINRSRTANPSRTRTTTRISATQLNANNNDDRKAISQNKDQLRTQTVAISRRPVLSVRRRLINSPTTAAATITTLTSSIYNEFTTTESPSATTSKFNSYSSNNNINRRIRPAATYSSASTATASAKYSNKNIYNQQLNAKYKTKSSAAAVSSSSAAAVDLSVSSSSSSSATAASVNDITQNQPNQQQQQKKYNSSPALRRKFQQRRIITTTTASPTDETANEQQRTQNPLFKRRYSFISTTPRPSQITITTPAATTTLSPHDSLTTTLFVDGLDNDDNTDQVAKSSIHSSLFNRIADEGEDDDDEVNKELLLSAIKTTRKTAGKIYTTTTTTATTLPAETSQQFVESITRRMDSFGNSAINTLTTRKPSIRRRPQKTTPIPVTLSTVTARRGGGTFANRRRPHKVAEPYERLNRNQAPTAEKQQKAKDAPGRTYRPTIDYDYYDDEDVRIVGNTAGQQLKVILHGRGIIECLDQGNFPHPLSCRKFISCAKFETGGVVGWEYTCPKGLSYDPVGGMCNWAAGLGCKE